MTVSRNALLLPLVGVLLAAASAGGPPPASGAPRGDCRTAGTTIDAGPGGRVFSLVTEEIDGVFLCSYRTGRWTRIGTDNCENAIEVEQVRFARRLLGVGLFSCGPRGAVSTFDVRRIRDGRRIRRVRTAFTADAFKEATDLVLRGDGALAWILEIRDTASAPPRYEVRTSVSGTASTLVAEGADIAPGSLARAGSIIYWTQAGAPRSATF